MFQNIVYIVQMNIIKIFYTFKSMEVEFFFGNKSYPTIFFTDLQILQLLYFDKNVKILLNILIKSVNYSKFGQQSYTPAEIVVDIFVFYYNWSRNILYTYKYKRN